MGSRSDIPAEERFAAIVEALRSEPGVTFPAEDPAAGRAFGSPGLKVHGRIFAMLSRGNLVVKLPRQRVDALVEAGSGERYDSRQDGRLMKEWLVVGAAHGEQWLALVREALAHVGAGR